MLLYQRVGSVVGALVVTNVGDLAGANVGALVVTDEVGADLANHVRF